MSHPSASATEAADAIAAEAAEDPSVGVPTPSNDLAGLDGSIASEANPPEPEPSEDEDWEFTEEVRIEGDDEGGTDEDFGVGTDFSVGFDEAGLEVDSLAESGTDLEIDDGPRAVESPVESLALEEDPSGFDLEPGGEEIGLADTPDDLAIGTDSDTDFEPDDNESSFGEVEDFSAATDDPDFAAEATQEPSHGDVADDANVGLYHESGASEDLGDPESWDLAPDADFNASKASIAGLVGAFSPSGDAARALGETGAFGADVDLTQFDAEDGGSSILRSGLSTILGGIGWLMTFGAIGLVVQLSVSPEWSRWSIRPQTLAIDSFVAETTATRWVETARTDGLLVVDGIARNTGGQEIWPQPIQVALLDTDGKRIPDAAIAAGTPLAERVLREATPAELERSTMRAPDQFLTNPLQPGESRAFQAVIAELPEEAKRFLLEAAEHVPSRVARDLAPDGTGWLVGRQQADADAGASVDGSGISDAELYEAAESPAENRADSSNRTE